MLKQINFQNFEGISTRIDNLALVNFIVGNPDVGKTRLLRYLSQSGEFLTDHYFPCGNCTIPSTRIKNNLIDRIKEATPYIMLIDNIETGLHYSQYKEVIEAVLYSAKRGKQFFITTHSYEVLESLNDVLKEIKEKGESLKVIPKDSDTPTDPLDLACVFELEKSSDDVVSYTKYHGLSLEGAVANDVEIRGCKELVCVFRLQKDGTEKVEALKYTPDDLNFFTSYGEEIR